jgi:hypothetical protein
MRLHDNDNNYISIVIMSDEERLNKISEIINGGTPINLR